MTTQIFHEGDRVRVKPLKHLQPKFHGADGAVVAWCHDHVYRVKLDAFDTESVFGADEIKAAPTTQLDNEQQPTPIPWITGTQIRGLEHAQTVFCNAFDTAHPIQIATFATPQDATLAVEAVNAYSAVKGLVEAARAAMLNSDHGLSCPAWNFGKYRDSDEDAFSVCDCWRKAARTALAAFTEKGEK